MQSQSLPVTLIIDNVVYMLDDIAMLPRIAKAAASTNASQETQPTVPLRILFVEDNDYIRELTLCMLEAAGREVVSCSSAEAAFETFEKAPFDVVITDVSLPKMSGLELAKKLRALSPSVWLIIVSGFQMSISLDGLGPRARTMGKPFESDQINHLLVEIANERSTR